MERMDTLANVLEIIRREIASALADNKPLPSETRLEADRVIVSLRVAIVEKDQKSEVRVITGSREPSGAETHTITVEFAVRGGALAAGAGQGGGLAQMEAESASATGIVNTFMAIFGVPGFDSSARATVFREALGGLPDEQARVLIGSLGGTLKESDERLKSGREMILRLLGRGPSGLERSAEVLKEMFERHSTSFLLRIIEETWKTPDAWA